MNGDRIGRYQLMHLLGSGGMGEVFLSMAAGPAGFSKIVVVKRILPFLASDAGAIDSFLHEARIAALLSHPNLVQIFELGQEEGTYFLAMEYVHGYSLRAIRSAMLKSGRWMIPGLAASVCAQALRGLHYAHNFRDLRGEPLQIVHRDVSPDNILVGFDGTVKVTDFGIAKISGDRGNTAPGVVKGKLAYIAPEQFRFRELDARADLFAMGAVLYELLTGRPPFKGASLKEYFDPTEKRPQPVRELNASCPPELEQVVLRALAWDPANRIQNALEFAQALEAIADEHRTRDPVTVAAFMRELYGPDAAAHHPAAAAISRTPLSLPAVPLPPRTRALTVEVSAALDLQEEDTERSSGAHSLAPPQRQLRPAAAVSTEKTLSVRAAQKRDEVVDAEISTTEPGPDPRPSKAKTAWIVASAAVVAALVGAGSWALNTQAPEDETVPAGGSGAPSSARSSPSSAAGTDSKETSGSAADGAVAAREVDSAEDAPNRVEKPTRPTSERLEPGGEQQAASADTAAAEEGARKKRVAAASAPPSRKAPSFGRLSVRATPWANVRLENRLLGATPLAGTQVPAGRHVLVLEHPPTGQVRRVVVNVPPNGEVVVKENFLEAAKR